MSQKNWADYPTDSESEEENVNNKENQNVKTVIKTVKNDDMIHRLAILLESLNCKKKNKNDDLIHLLANLLESLICEIHDLSEKIDRKNIENEELNNTNHLLQLVNMYLHNENFNLNVNNNHCKNVINYLLHFNHPDNVYPDKNIDKEECISISSIQSNLINFNQNNKLSYDVLSKIDLNKSEIFIDEDKTNYIGDINPLLQIVFGNELDKVLSSCRGILNTQYDDNNRLFIRQINILTIIMSNGESIVVSASAVSRSFMYVHFKHMIKICEKCTRCWLLTDDKYEYLYSNRQELIEYDENHTNQTCSGWKQPVKQVDN